MKNTHKTWKMAMAGTVWWVRPLGVTKRISSIQYFFLHFLNSISKTMFSSYTTCPCLAAVTPVKYEYHSNKYAPTLRYTSLTQKRFFFFDVYDVVSADTKLYFNLDSWVWKIDLILTIYDTETYFKSWLIGSQLSEVCPYSVYHLLTRNCQGQEYVWFIILLSS